MPLPILQSHPNVNPDDLIRFYHRTEQHWSGQVADETQLDGGTAFTNATLDKVWQANHVLDASIPPGATPADVVAEVERHFSEQRVHCCKWVLNPAVPRAQTEPLRDHLVASGCTRLEQEIMYLAGQPAGAVREVSGLQIIPARASFRHARELLAESSLPWNEPQLIESGVLHLEDPHTDALIALKDGAAAALVCVLTVGEIGCIEQLFVSERFRRQGIGRTMMSRAMEICARSLFRHVFLSVEPDNAPAKALYANLGFQKIGPFTAYRAS